MEQFKYKFYSSYITGIWAVDQSNPWHFQRARTITELVEDIADPLKNGIWDYSINLNKFKSCNKRSSQSIGITRYSTEIVMGVSNLQKWIKEPATVKPEDLQSQIEKYIKLSYLI